MNGKQAKRVLIVMFTACATMLLMSPTSVQAGGGTKMRRPLVQPGPGSITTGYSAWKSGYGSCRAEYWIGSESMGQTVFEGDITNGSVTYKDAQGNTHTISGNVAVVHRNGTDYAYKCMSMPIKRTPKNDPATQTRGRHPYDRRAQ